MADNQELDVRLSVLEKAHEDHIKQCSERFQEVRDALKTIRTFLGTLLLTALVSAVSFGAHALLNVQ